MTQVQKPAQDRVWLITGCSSGLGQALAEAVLARGERVVATARNRQQVEPFAARYPGRALALSLDVTRGDSITQAVEDTLAHMGRIDVLVNNAGYGIVGAVEEVDGAEVRQIFETNVHGLLKMTSAVLPHMRGRRSGHILNISSMGGLVALAGFGIYSATKFAVEGLSEALAGELKPLGIRVTIVEPGPFRTHFRGGLAIAARTIADYDATVGPVRKTVTGAGGALQPGDPALAAAVMIAAVDAPSPPLRLPLGQICHDQIKGKLASLDEDIAAWRHLSIPTAFQA